MGVRPLFDANEAIDFLMKQKVRIRLNVVSQEIEVDGLPSSFNENKLNNFFVWAFDLVRRDYAVTRQHSDDLFRFLACLSAYNPILDKLKGIAPDGKDYLTELYEVLGLPADDELSRTLLHKWALQNIALLHNCEEHPVSADGILVLCGGQGIGKTSVVRALGGGSKFCKLGLSIDPHCKDTLITATGAWIGELAELESTLRTDIQQLKAFITSESDELRRPYERVATKTPRRTSYIGTVNSTDFLIDTTGNRRFWTIMVTKIDLERLRQFDGWQFWAQIKGEYDREKDKGNEDVCFRLSQEERTQLDLRNAGHERQLPAEQELRDIIDTYSDNPNYRVCWTTVTEFKECFAELKPYSSAKLSKALDKLGITAERRRINGSVVRARRLPLPKCVAANWQKSEVVNAVDGL